MQAAVEKIAGTPRPKPKRIRNTRFRWRSSKRRSIQDGLCRGGLYFRTPNHAGGACLLRNVAYAMYEAVARKFPALAKYFRVHDVTAPVDLLQR